MAKGINQKLKLLYIAKILNEQTDEEHPMSTAVLIEKLSEYEISAERKSIYDDIEQLIDFGYDINKSRSRTNGGYYIGERQFQMSELKLLVDCILASRFISLKKSRELIDKIEKMASVHEGKQLKRTVYVQNRVKTDNESIYYLVNDIYSAISDNKKISFCYMDWNINKRKEPRHDGLRYVISPFALTIKDENYYLIAYDDKADMIKHYRVDKISKICIEDEPRTGIDKFKSFDVATYTDRSFGMYSGTDETVSLKLPETMVGIIIDRFGTGVDIRKLEDGIISARVKVSVSEQFYGWVSSLGGDVVISGPENVKNEYIAFLDKLIGKYK